jgi:hypothetical protein
VTASQNSCEGNDDVSNGGNTPFTAGSLAAAVAAKASVMNIVQVRDVRA